MCKFWMLSLRRFKIKEVVYWSEHSRKRRWKDWTQEGERTELNQNEWTKLVAGVDNYQIFLKAIRPRRELHRTPKDRSRMGMESSEQSRRRRRLYLPRGLESSVLSRQLRGQLPAGPDVQFLRPACSAGRHCFQHCLDSEVEKSLGKTPGSKIA